MIVSRFLILICVGLVAAQRTAGAEVRADVSVDRWMYPFNASPGSRPSGSTFGALGNPSFDDYDAQLLLGFDTAAAGIPSGVDPSLYRLLSAAVLLTTSTEDAFLLDETYDSYATYLADASDEDPGRPVELFGVGFRNGYTEAGIGEGVDGPPVFALTESFAPPGPPVPANGVRNAFASDYFQGVARDVSNHVRDAFDVNPWAIGQADALVAGQSVPIDTTLQFAIDLDNADALAYLQSGLNRGQLFFSAASLHASTAGSDQGIPSFHLGTLQGESLGQRAQLLLEYEIVPEPTGVLWIGSAFGILLPFWRRRFVV